MPEEELFNRYAGADQGSQSELMPRDSLNARVSSLCIGELLGNLEKFQSDDSSGKARYPWATRFVMGYPLPSWQRPLVWTMEQKVRFIQSIWFGIDLGTYMVNECYEFVEEAGGKSHYREFSDILLDGQQRLSALEDYVFNRFPVPDASGVLRYWSDLGRVERRGFCAIPFARASVSTWDEAELRKAYDLRAFGGTPHTEDQRAVKA